MLQVEQLLGGEVRMGRHDDVRQARGNEPSLPRAEDARRRARVDVHVRRRASRPGPERRQRRVVVVAELRQRAGAACKGQPQALEVALGRRPSALVDVPEQGRVTAIRQTVQRPEALPGPAVRRGQHSGRVGVGTGGTAPPAFTRADRQVPARRVWREEGGKDEQADKGGEAALHCRRRHAMTRQ